jgi:Uma2 family endonuclease
MSGKDVMKPAASDVKLTYDDFLLFPDDGRRHELIDGEHYVTAAPVTRHQRIVGNIYFSLRLHLEVHPTGEVIASPLDVILSKHDVVEPDLLYVSKERSREILKDFARGAPDLVVEVGSPGTRRRDETIKRRLYERFGVVEYWIVNPDIEVVRIYRREDGAFSRPVELSREAGDMLTTLLLPDLMLPLAKMFEDPATSGTSPARG